jgi:hypothetical protein
VEEKAAVKPPAKRGAVSKKGEEKPNQESAGDKAGDPQPTKKAATNGEAAPETKKETIPKEKIPKKVVSDGERRAQPSRAAKEKK